MAFGYRFVTNEIYSQVGSDSFDSAKNKLEDLAKGVLSNGCSAEGAIYEVVNGKKKTEIAFAISRVNGEIELMELLHQN